MTDRVAIVNLVADESLPAADEVVARSISAAGAVASGLASHQWNRLDVVLGAEGDTGTRGDGARRILGELRTSLDSNEFVTPLTAALRKSDNNIFGWLEASPPPTPPTPPIPPPPPPPGGSGVIPAGAGIESILPDLRHFLEENQEHTVVVEWRIDE